MRAHEFLFETALSRGDFGPQDRKQNRIDAFIQMYQKGMPFYLTGGGGQVVLKRDQATLALLKSLSTYDYKEFPNAFLTKDGRTVSLTQLEKTKEFGGVSAVDNPEGKESLPIKPSQIGISATATKFDPNSPDALKIALATGAFRAGDLGGKIQSDNVLKGAGPTGLAVINMSAQISANQVPDMPKKTQLPTTALKAIRDYAGEYLGVQQLVQGIANFPNIDDFFEFMSADQQSLGDLMLYFPKSTNTPLADSLALQNTATGHVIKLSSKGAKAGAPPSLDNLIVPESLRSTKNKNIGTVIKFLDEARASSAANQPFRMIQFLINYAPDTVPDFVKGMFPVTGDEFKKLYATKKDPYLPCPRKFLKLANIKGSRGEVLSGTHYGRVHYQLNKIVLDAINKKNALPAFRKTVLEILSYNFVQIFSRERQGKLYADVLWPGTVRGNVEIYSKSSSADPDHQKLSFSITD